MLNARKASIVGKGLMMFAAGLSAVVLTASPAAAAVDDGFKASIGGGCGVAEFVDYGPGSPSNPANNDDYIVVHDYCADGMTILAYAYLNNVYYGSKANNNGAAGAPVYWDPWGNVLKGDKMELSVCLLTDGYVWGCSSDVARVSADG
ncbi:hypothetical protein AB0M47_05150 [Hamadaea sp. NPDC051192]|uniref:hypothetical protein n=1 Tax=Hamadaea sp. NPDC051192 TaxID=3154940 RepID=UPI00342257B5